MPCALFLKTPEQILADVPVHDVNRGAAKLSRESRRHARQSGRALRRNAPIRKCRFQGNVRIRSQDAHEFPGRNVMRQLVDVDLSRNVFDQPPSLLPSQRISNHRLRNTVTTRQFVRSQNRRP